MICWNYDERNKSKYEGKSKKILVVVIMYEYII